MMFYLADGYSKLVDPEEFTRTTFEEWKSFICEVSNKLEINDFKYHTIYYNPKLTKVQLFKIKKKNPKVPEYLITPSLGQVIEIPSL